ncbi:MAG: class II glutamine amidotransferase [Ktedonobacteraceae bacterium]
MCRLLAYVSREPVMVSDLLNTVLTAFIDASHFHCDGWGLAWYDQSNRLQSTKTTVAAYASPELPMLAEQIQTDAFIGHLRWATKGFNVCLANTHPFTYHELAFAHNGVIKPEEAIEELIAPHLRPLLTGTTDSERHFFALLSVLEGAAEPIEGIRSYLEHLHERTQPMSTNFLLLTPQTLYAVCDFDPCSERSQEDPDYFPLLYRLTPDAVLIGSTGLSQDEEWRHVNNGYMLVVDRGTLDVAIVDLMEHTRSSLQEPCTSTQQ